MTEMCRSKAHIDKLNRILLSIYPIELWLCIYRHSNVNKTMRRAWAFWWKATQKNTQPSNQTKTTSNKYQRLCHESAPWSATRRLPYHRWWPPPNRPPTQSHWQSSGCGTSGGQHCRATRARPWRSQSSFVEPLVVVFVCRGMFERKCNK